MSSISNYKALLGDIEVHDIEAIRYHFESGINPNDRFDDGRHEKSLIDYMISMYMRSPRFADCVRLFFEYGLEWEDEYLKALLLNDANGLKILLSKNPELLEKRFVIDNAYVAMHEVGAMHICAEFNHTACAKVLLEAGADVNTTSGIDKYGLGGQTPLFHTVNQNSNASWEMLNWLLENGADPTYTIKGLIWGETYPWQTMFPGINPISFAMMGLMPMVHRSEQQVKSSVDLLLKSAYGIEYDFPNFPNAYLS